MWAWSSGACFADFGHEVDLRRQGPVQDRAAGTRARSRSSSRGWTIWSPPTCAAGRLSFALDGAEAIRTADAVFIAVGTPSRRGDGHADLSYVYAAAEEIAGLIEGFTVVVTKSTVPVGTGDEIERIIRARRPDAEFAVVSNPEFLREGAAIEDFKRPDRVVVGTEDERAQAVMRELYRPLNLNETPILFTGRRTSRTDQICGQRLPGHEDHLHQRDGRPVRDGRRRRAAGGARHRAGQADRRRNSCMPAPAMAARAFPRTPWPWCARPRTPARRCG